MKMNQEESEKIGMTAGEYFSLFSQIRESVGDRDVALVIFQEMTKDMIANQIRQERQDKANGAASEKQKSYLRRLGVDFRPDITSAQASKLIDEAKKREG